MKVSTRGRYALRVIIDLAESCCDDQLIPMKIIAARQQISLKYLEQILPILTKGGLIEGVHGKGGGYRLCRTPDNINVYDILVLTEGDLATVACLSEGSEGCRRSIECRTVSLWSGLDRLIKDYLSSVSIADLMR